jgi:hypothetical protein
MWGHEFALSQEILLKIFQFKDGTAIASQRTNDMQDLGHLFLVNSYSSKFGWLVSEVALATNYASRGY